MDKKQIEKIRKKLQERKYVTNKAVEEIKTICSIIARMEGIETVKQCLVEAGWNKWNDYRLPVYFGIREGDVVTGFWNNEYFDENVYTLGDAVKNRNISIAKAVEVLENFFKELEKIKVPKESAEKISKILQTLKK